MQHWRVGINYPSTKQIKKRGRHAICVFQISTSEPADLISWNVVRTFAMKEYQNFLVFNFVQSVITTWRTKESPRWKPHCTIKVKIPKWCMIIDFVKVFCIVAFKITKSCYIEFILNFWFCSNIESLELALWNLVYIWRQLTNVLSSFCMKHCYQTTTTNMATVRNIRLCPHNLTQSKFLNMKKVILKI